MNRVFLGLMVVIPVVLLTLGAVLCVYWKKGELRYDLKLVPIQSERFSQDYGKFSQQTKLLLSHEEEKRVRDLLLEVIEIEFGVVPDKWRKIMPEQMLLVELVELAEEAVDRRRAELEIEVRPVEVVEVE